MTDKPCDFCGLPLEGMRADAKFHPECADAERRERQRGGKLRDRLIADLHAARLHQGRVVARQVDLEAQLRGARRVERACVEALDRLDGKRRRGFWRLLREIWNPELQDDRHETANGRTSPETDAS